MFLLSWKLIINNYCGHDTLEDIEYVMIPVDEDFLKFPNQKKNLPWIVLMISKYYHIFKDYRRQLWDRFLHYLISVPLHNTWKEML